MSWSSKLDRLSARIEAAERLRGGSPGRFAAYRDRPVDFQRDVLGRSLWSKQEAICRTVVDSPVTVVPAGRAIGKSWTMAGLALWWLYSRRNSLVITTGPDHRQVVSVLWGEIRAALAGARERLPYEHLTQGYVSPQRLTVSSVDRWEALGWAAKTVEGFSGQHSGELLVVVDEASGISEPIWSAIHGLAPNRLVVCGNPLSYDSRFRELHDLASQPEGQVKSITISSLESPDAGLETSPRGMADASFLRFMRVMHGEGSPWWSANILGHFPGQEAVRFLPLAHLDACTNPSIPLDDLWRDYAPGPALMAIDVGGGVGADRSVIVVRNDKQLLEVFSSEWHGVLDDARHRLEPVVIELARRWGVHPDHCTYDAAGLGRPFGSYLESRGFGGIAYFGAGKGGRYYANRRTANAFRIKHRLDPLTKAYVPFYTGGIPEWAEMRRELSELRAPLMLFDGGVVKQELETKADWQARLHRSPDLADAFIQSFTYRIHD